MDKSSTSEIHTDDEVHTVECIADTLKKVSIDESKNTVQPAPPLKPDTPKIAVKQWSYKFLLTDTLTDSVVGLYPTNKAATLVVIELVKKDLINYVNDFQLKILKGESIEENRMYLANIKHLTYQYNTIEQSLNTSITIDNKTTSRYKILCLKENEPEVDESDFVML